MFKEAFATGRFTIQGPKPFRVEYPYGLPGDGFRSFARQGKATCIAYHKAVDPSHLDFLDRGNTYRYGPGDERWNSLVDSLKERGFVGGDGQRIIIHVDKDRAYIAEGNHRLKACLEIGIGSVDVEIRYLHNTDETYLLIPFDQDDPNINVESE